MKTVNYKIEVKYWTGKNWTPWAFYDNPSITNIKEAKKYQVKLEKLSRSANNAFRIRKETTEITYIQ